MKTNTDLFRQLHHNAEPLFIGNVWNVQSARVFEKRGFNAIATSSAAVAETLGYEDGESMHFDEYLFIIRRICASVNIPLSVDLEAGYGHSVEEITRNIIILGELGVAGINIEDSVVADGKRTIESADVFAAKLTSIIAALKAQQSTVFINVRSDTFLLGLSDALQESVTRIKKYEATGSDGLFFPCVTDLGDIKKLTSTASLPVNVMCMPDLPSFADLQQAGVKRISMGNFLNKNIYAKLDARLQVIQERGNFDSIFKS